MAMPFVTEFNWKRVYAEQTAARQEAKDCVMEYYRGEGRGDCPTTYPGNIAPRLERAQALGIAFARHSWFRRTAQRPDAVEGGKCFIDTVNGALVSYYGKPPIVSMTRSRFLTMRGWAVDDEQSKSAPKDVSIRLDSGGTSFAKAARRAIRLDLGIVFKDPVYEQGGFLLGGSLAGVPNGVYAIRVIQRVGDKELICNPNLTLDLRGGPPPQRPLTAIGGVCTVDEINGKLTRELGSPAVAVFPRTRPFQVRGWSAFQPGDPTQSPVVIRLEREDGTHVSLLTDTDDRPDLAAAYKNPAFASAGFKISHSNAWLPAGSYALKVIRRRDQKDLECNPKITVRVRDVFQSIKKGKQFPEAGKCYVDFMSAPLKPGEVRTWTANRTEPLSIGAWAVDERMRGCSQPVAIQLDGEKGNRYLLMASREERLDVAQTYKEPMYRNSGLRTLGLVSDLPSDTYALRILQYRNEQEILCDPRTVVVVP
jgi:hypothetical protein